MDDPLVVSYSILGRQRRAPAREPVASSQIGLLPAKNFNYQRYMESNRDLLITGGGSEYLRQLTSGSGAVDPVIILPVINELAFIAGNEDFYSYTSAEIVVSLAPYLTNSKGRWDEQKALAQRRQVVILNSIGRCLLPILDDWLFMTDKLAFGAPEINDLSQARLLNDYLKETYRRWLPRVPEEGEIVNELHVEAVFRHSGWFALINEGLASFSRSTPDIDRLQAFSGGGYGQKFPAGQFWTLLNSAYHSQPIDHWQHYEDDLFSALSAAFEDVMRYLARSDLMLAGK